MFDMLYVVSSSWIITQDMFDCVFFSIICIQELIHVNYLSKYPQVTDVVFNVVFFCCEETHKLTSSLTCFKLPPIH